MPQLLPITVFDIEFPPFGRDDCIFRGILSGRGKSGRFCRPLFPLPLADTDSDCLAERSEASHTEIM